MDRAPKFKTLQSKLTLYFSIIIIFIAIVISVFISNIFSKEIITQTNNIVLKNIDLITRQIETNMNTSLSFTNTLRKNKYIKNLLASSTQNKNDTYMHTLSMSKTLSIFASRNNSIISIIVIDKYGQILDPVYSNSNYKKIVKGDADFNNFIKSGHYTSFSEPSSFPITNYTSMDKGTISCYQPLNSYPSWRVIGIVSNEQLNKNFYKLVSSVILISIFFILLLIILNYFICKKLTYPIHKISKSINSF